MNPLHEFGIEPCSFSEEDLVFAAVDLPNPDPQEAPCELFVACRNEIEGSLVRDKLATFSDWQKA